MTSAGACGFASAIVVALAPDGLRASGIGVNLHYIPVHLHPYYRKFGFQPGDFPEAERYCSEAISLAMYAGLSDAQQDEVVRAVGDALLER
jgi:dTDP-4-amino-4,6-dideoxygalactose transaminase